MALSPKTYEIPPSPYGGVLTITQTYPHAVGEKAPASTKITDIPGAKALWATSVYVQNTPPPPAAPTVQIAGDPTGPSGEISWTTTGEVTVTACSLDGNTVTPSGDTYTYTGLAPGSHAFAVAVTGPGGGPVAASVTWSVPLPPAPTVTIGNTPSGASGSIAWAVVGQVAQTVLTLDGVAVTPTSNGVYDYSGLSVGSHTFIVEVEGPGGSNTAEVSWTVVAPVTGPAVVSTPAGPQLQLSGKRLFLNGWTAWPLNDHIASTNGNAAALAANFAAFCKIAAANGVNCLRVRTLASDLTAATIPAYATQAAGLVKIAQANGVPYVSFCDWAPLDGPNPGGGWAGTETNAYPLFTAIMSALGGPNATGVIWEPFNEPNGISWAQWVTAFESVITFFRHGAGYVGPLILDPINWANEYDSGSFQAVWDADGDALGGTPNLLFAQHVYYEGSSWSAGNYPVISQSVYPSIVTETGYYNNGTVNETFSQASAPALAALGTTLATYAGTQFFCGVWVDQNTILTAPLTASPAFSEPWGGIVQGALNPTPVTPPSGLVPYDPNNLLGSGWKNVLDEEFKGNKLSDLWNPYWYQDGHQAPGYGFPTDSKNVIVNDGLSLLSAGDGSGSLVSTVTGPDNGGPNPGFMIAYSGNSLVPGNFSEAYIEIYWGVPVENNAVTNQVTFWLTSDSWGSPGSLEIDVAEAGPALNMNLHYGGANTKNVAASTTLDGNGTVWCRFGLLLTAGSFSRLFNGGNMVTVTNGEYGNGMSTPTQREGIVINNGPSGTATLLVAYVRAWQR